MPSLTLTIDVPTLNPDDIKDAAVREAARQILGMWTEEIVDEDGQPSETTNDATLRKLRAAAEQHVQECVKRVVEARVPAVVDEVLSREFQPMTRWGEKEGPATTIRAMVGSYAQNYLTEKVDGTGRSRSQGGYSDCNTPRMHHLIRVEVERVFKAELSSAADKAAKEVKAGLVDKLSGQLAAAVAKILGIT